MVESCDLSMNDQTYPSRGWQKPCGACWAIDVCLVGPVVQTDMWLHRCSGCETCQCSIPMTVRCCKGTIEKRIFQSCKSPVSLMVGSGWWKPLAGWIREDVLTGLGTEVDGLTSVEVDGLTSMSKHYGWVSAQVGPSVAFRWWEATESAPGRWKITSYLW